MEEQEPGGPDICACPDCDYETEKERGVPCRSVACPKCGEKLVAKVEAEEMTIAQHAIDTARAIINGSAMFTKIAAEKGNTPERAANRMLDELQRELAEATMKTVAGKERPAGDFLVVGDAESVDTWALPVKINGKPDHRLMGAAWAALHGGYRGNKYEGPDKAKVLANLKALYKSEDMETPTVEAAVSEMYGEPVQILPYTAMTFADMAAADEANQTAENVRHLSRRFQTLFTNVMFSEEITDKIGAVRGLVDELATLMGETPTAEAETPEVSLGELHADGVAVEVARDATEADLSEVEAAIETGRRAPVIVDFQILQPGPGNKRDKRYYPADVVARDIGVFEGVAIFATDHKEKERSERTKVGKVLRCPTRFTETKAPVARALIYDPDQAEKTRNRNDAGQLATMECSIYGTGKAKSGTVNGKKYSIVQEMTEGKFLELVSEAGAGGKALNLAESDNGGEDMSGNEEKTPLAPDDAEVSEVDIQENEGEAEQEADETPTMLESEAVETALAETNLPSAFKVALGKADYADADALKEAIDEATAEVKKITGSGQVRDLGETEPPKAETLTVEERERRALGRYNETKRNLGLQEVK